MPALRESEEMMYQFEYDYRFDSSKVARVYTLNASSYRDGIATTLAGRDDITNTASNRR